MPGSTIPDDVNATDAPVATDPTDYQRVRDLLSQVGYTDEGVVKVLGVDTLSRLRERKLPALLRRTAGGTPLETLIRLFILDQPVEADAARQALAPMTLDTWIAIGLLGDEGTRVRARVQLRCYQGLVMAYDFPRRGPGGLRSDYVMGVSPSSLVVLGLTPRRASRATLDLGTGCGIQALVAAAHSEHVVAIDCNPRALAITRFNRLLNGAGNVEPREGDMFGPVAGETFDLIVSNPPFIVSPDARHLFLNSGTDGDEVCRRIAADAPRFLNEDGLCLFNANWAIADGEDWRARLAGWFTGTGCDALVICQDILDVGEYAASLIEIGDDEREEYLRLFDEWMAFYAARGIARIGRGVVVMRRATARSNWFAAEMAPAGIVFPCGDDLLQLVELRTFLHTLGDDQALLEARLRIASNVRVDRVCESVPGGWRATSGRLYRTGGFEYSGSVDQTTQDLLGRYDGLRPVREHLSDLAEALERSVEDVAPQALAIVRRMVEQGFLVPA